MEISGNEMVSVVVVSYNSAPFILETLESIRRQTYRNIELVISDDCSKDDTVEVCRRWIGDHGSRFAAVELVQTPVNTGVPSNCNRGLAASRGRWIKFIAGDDVLLDNCIEEMVRFVESAPDVSFVSAGIIPFDELRDYEPEFASGKLRLRTAAEQFKALLRENCMMPAPALFLSRAALERIGGFDEKYSILEDVPLYIKVLDSGFRIDFLDKPLVRYRCRMGSIMNSGETRHSEQVLQFSRDYVIPLLIRKRFYLLCWHVMVLNYSIEKSKKKFFLIDNIYLRNLFWLAVDPLYWVVLFGKLKGRLRGDKRKLAG